MIAVADSALYVAKRGGRNQVAQSTQAAKVQKLPTARKSTAAKTVADNGVKAAAKAPRTSTAKPVLKRGGKKKG